MATSLAKKDNKLDVATTFNRKGQHDLNATIKLLKSAADKAVQTLVKLTGSDDPKIALEASKAITHELARMTEQRDRDEITRKIAAVKLQGVKPSESEYDNMPRIDFSNIQNVE